MLISDPANIPFLTSFSLIIASEQPPHVLQALSELCWNAASSPSSSSSAVASASIPLLSIKVSGFLASLQFQVKELGSEFCAHTPSPDTTLTIFAHSQSSKLTQSHSSRCA